MWPYALIWCHVPKCRNSNYLAVLKICNISYLLLTNYILSVSACDQHKIKYCPLPFHYDSIHPYFDLKYLVLISSLIPETTGHKMTECLVSNIFFKCGKIRMFCVIRTLKCHQQISQISAMLVCSRISTSGSRIPICEKSRTVLQRSLSSSEAPNLVQDSRPGTPGEYPERYTQ